MPYNMQLTEQIPNDPLRMGAKSTTTSNHPSTPITVSLFSSMMSYIVTQSLKTITVLLFSKPV